MSKKTKIANHIESEIRQGTLQIQGMFRPDTLNEEERTVEVIFTTGEGGRRYDWWNDVEYIEELDVTPESIRAARLDKGLSILDNHNRWSGCDGVFGITEDYRYEEVDGVNALVGTCRFASDEDSDKMFTKVKEKVLRHVSLGYNVHEYTKSKGSDDKLPTYRATDWEPTELSFVPVSFETTNGIRSEEMTEERKKQPTHTVIIKEERSMSKDKDNKVPVGGERAAAPVTPAEPAPATPEVKPEGERAAEPTPAAPAEPAAPVGIQRNAEDLNVMTRAAADAGLDSKFATDAFVRGDSVDAFYRSIVDELGNQSKEKAMRNQAVPASDNRADQQESTRNAQISHLLVRSNQSPLAGVDATATRQFIGMTLMDMARGQLERQGISTMGMSPMKVAERAFHSTSDFPLILENVMNKSLQSGYAAIPQTFKQLGRQTTVNDFREKHIYNLGDAPQLLPLGEHGEYKAGTIGEGKEKYSIGTYARKIGFTRQMLINDDMSALSTVPQAFGRAGNNLESNIVWGMLLGWNFFTNKADLSATKMANGKNWFHADHGNLLSGAGSALSKDALKALRKLGRKQRTPSNDFLNVIYDYLIVGDDLESDAEELMFPNYAANTLENAPVRHKMDLVVEPRIAIATNGNTRFMGVSKALETFEYAYLAGEEEMMTEVSTQTDIDGMEIKVRKDFGAGIVDYRGMALSEGK